jgi:hypothetical protein
LLERHSCEPRKSGAFANVDGVIASMLSHNRAQTPNLFAVRADVREWRNSLDASLFHYT